MKKYNYISTVIISLMLIMLFPVTVSANSSWHWLTDIRPAGILPFAIAGTLLIETLAINFIPKIKKSKKVFCVVSIANILSFLMPYIGGMFDEIYGLPEMLDHTPFYTVGITFLFMTIVTELPFVYLFLRKETQNTKRLLITIIIANTLTTFMVAIIERTLCYGSW